MALILKKKSGITPLILILTAAFWLSTDAMASNNIDQTSFEDEGIENDNRSRYTLRKAMAHNMLVRYPDLYAFFAKASRKTMPPVVLDSGNMFLNGISSDDSIDTEQTGKNNLMMPPSRRSPYKSATLCNRCESGFTRLVFGEDHFPRALFQTTCGQDVCPGLFVCRPLTFPLSVLKRRRGEAEAGNVPRSLQSEWTTVTHDVTVACLCQHPDN